MTSFDTLQELITALARLPGIGRRSAERIALELVDRRRGLLGDLLEALTKARDKITRCDVCGGVTAVDEQPCRTCSDGSRDTRQICVVEQASDILTIEAAGEFRGRYHALVGRLSPMKGDGPENLRVKALLERVAKEKPEEIILALNTDVESDATASFLTEVLQGKGVKVTRLAFGLPAGSGIMYSDPVTLARAIRGRQSTE